jgi:hypothetical protein
MNKKWRRGAIKQTAATKICSRNFGIASNAAKIFRQHFGDTLPFPKNKKMQSRFSGAVNKWLGVSDTDNLPPEENLSYVNGFSFNEACNITATWKVPLTVTKENDQLIILHIPAFVPSKKMIAPPRTVAITCTIAATSWNWNNSNLQNSSKRTISIPFTNESLPAQDIPLPIPAGRKYLLITIVALEFITGDGERDNRDRYRPCSVVDARYC